jgi:predicted phosphoribosyltransferase
MLARKLASRLNTKRRSSLIVLAIPRGGVITGAIIAESLGISLDLVIAKKVGFPSNPEFAIGAVMHDGSFIPNEDIDVSTDVLRHYILDKVSDLKKEINRRLIMFRGNKKYDLQGKTAILVDDGIATGATMLAAIKWLKTQRLEKLILAVPVGPADTIEKMRDIVDEVLVLYAPTMFNAVGSFYKDFRQVSDDEVIDIMKKHRKTD